MGVFRDWDIYGYRASRYQPCTGRGRTGGVIWKVELFSLVLAFFQEFFDFAVEVGLEQAVLDDAVFLEF